VNELMAMEVDMLNTLQLKLHMPTCHDMLHPYLVEMGEALAYPDGKEQSMLRNWLECLTLIGQANYNVVLHDPSTLARCVATLGELLAKGVGRNVAQEDGSTSEGVIGARLRDRACHLRSELDWECMKDLIKGVDAAMKDSREMIVKCHPKFVALKPLAIVMDELARGDIGHTHLKPKDVQRYLDKFYPVEKARDSGCFLEKEAFPAEKKAYVRGAGNHLLDKDATDEQRGPAGPLFNIVSVTCALGKQLIAERAAPAKSVTTRSSTSGGPSR